ncbi:MAG: NRDE family protein [Marinoscillum sp.]
MCLITFAWDVHPKYKLILTANRDEFYERPTTQAGFWAQDENILGGQDLKAGGSWMTISRKGHFAAVTNFRDLANIRADATSRGEIPTDFMSFSGTPEAFLQKLHAHSDDYNGFNVLLGNLNQLAHYSNYERKLNVLKGGVYGLSNALLDTPWPKVELAKSKFTQVIKGDFDLEDLIAIMADTQVAEENVLPDTGVTREMEKALSAMCIRMENYGTCCTTAITVDRHGEVNFAEKSYPVGGRKDTTVRYQFKIS